MTQEHNLNAATILQDMYENKEYVEMMFKEDNLKKILEFATVPLSEGSKSSKTAALNVFNHLLE